MQNRVHVVGAGRPAGERREIGFGRGAPALEARAVAGRERHRLVGEESRCRPRSRPSPATLEFADADDPAPRRPAALQALRVVVQPAAAVAHHLAPRAHRMEVAERIDAVLQRSCSGWHPFRHCAILRFTTKITKDTNLRALRVLCGEGFLPRGGGPHGARTQTQLRGLRQGPAAGRGRRDDLHLRVHLLRRLRRDDAPERLPELRRRLAPRPIRPAREWRPGLSTAKRPPSAQRVRLSFTREQIANFVRAIAAIPPHLR